MMKKNFILRSLFATLLCALFIPFVGCKETDEPDGPNPDTPPNVPEVQYEKLNINLASLQSIIENLSEDDLATRLAPITENETQVGYTIYFLQNAPVNIYTGLDGKIPAISVIEEGGQYYWTIDGDAQGNMYAVKEVLPQTQVAEEQWQISWDEGKKWSNATASSDTKINASQNEDWILLSFNGATISIPKNAALGCTFDISFNNTNSSSTMVTITPSENDVHYYWSIYEMDETEEEIKEFIQSEIEYLSSFPEKYTPVEYWSLYATQGITTQRLKNLTPNTTYKVMAVAIDMTTGKYAGEFTWKEFTTADRNPNDKVSISIECPNYFDVMDMYKIAGGGYAAYKDWCYAICEVTTEGAPLNYYWALTPNVQSDGSKVENMPGEQIVATLLSGQYGIKQNIDNHGFYIQWDTEYALIGTAEGADGNYYYTVKVKTFNPAGASDIRLMFPTKQDSEETSMNVVSKSKLPSLKDNQVSHALTLVK